MLICSAAFHDRGVKTTENHFTHQIEEKHELQTVPEGKEKGPNDATSPTNHTAKGMYHSHTSVATRTDDDKILKLRPLLNQR